jgi:hypothetical protein
VRNERVSRTSIVIFSVLLATANVGAQEHPNRSLVPTDYPKWDLSGSIGFLSARTSELKRTGWSGYEGKADYQIHVGRYWTTHIKTGVSFGVTNAWDDVIQEVILIPGLPGLPPAGFSFITVHRRQYVVAPTVSYQFRENTFMHPYLAAGVRVGLLREHRFRDAIPFPVRGVAVSAASIDEWHTTIQGRPFVEGGFKSYFNRSVFVRTDGQLTFSRDGVAVGALHAGIGFDF